MRRKDSSKHQAFSFFLFSFFFDHALPSHSQPPPITTPTPPKQPAAAPLAPLARRTAAAAPKILARAASLRSTSSGSSSSSSNRSRSISSSSASPTLAFVTEAQRQKRTAAARCRSSASSAVVAMASSSKSKIVVTGAGGRTGKLTVDYLLARPEAFDVVAVARSDKALKDFAAKGAATAVVDVTAEGAEAALVSAFAGAEAVIIATSAVPKIQKRSLVKILLLKLVKKQARPTFTWKGGNEKGAPIEVDWLGQKRQIDAAVKAGVKRVVIVSSMGVTQVRRGEEGREELFFLLLNFFFVHRPLLL